MTVLLVFFWSLRACARVLPSLCCGTVAKYIVDPPQQSAAPGVGRDTQFHLCGGQSAWLQPKEAPERISQSPQLGVQPQPRSGWTAAARSTQPWRASATGKSSVFPSVCAPPALQIFGPVQGHPLQQSTLARRPYKIAQKTLSWQSQSRSGNRSRRATPRLRRQSLGPKTRHAEHVLSQDRPDRMLVIPRSGFVLVWTAQAESTGASRGDEHARQETWLHFMLAGIYLIPVRSSENLSAERPRTSCQRCIVCQRSF